MLARLSDWSGFPTFRAGPSFPTASLREELDRLFGEFERGPAHAERALSSGPRLKDEGNAFTLRAELPGLSDKDIELTVTARVVTLKAERKVEVPEGYTAHRRERTSFTFARSYELPSLIDPEKVEANLKQGVLSLRLPKVSEAQPKRVTVTAKA